MLRLHRKAHYEAHYEEVSDLFGRSSRFPGNRPVFGNNEIAGSALVESQRPPPRFATERKGWIVLRG
jgi:hypothetical protein